MIFSEGKEKNAKIQKRIGKQCDQQYHQQSCLNSSIFQEAQMQQEFELKIRETTHVLDEFERQRYRMEKGSIRDNMYISESQPWQYHRKQVESFVTRMKRLQSQVSEQESSFVILREWVSLGYAEVCYIIIQYLLKCNIYICIYILQKQKKVMEQQQEAIETIAIRISQVPQKTQSVRDALKDYMIHIGESINTIDSIFSRNWTPHPQLEKDDNTMAIIEKPIEFSKNSDNKVVIASSNGTLSSTRQRQATPAALELAQKLLNTTVPTNSTVYGSGGGGSGGYSQLQTIFSNTTNISPYLSSQDIMPSENMVTPNLYSMGTNTTMSNTSRRRSKK